MKEEEYLRAKDIMDKVEKLRALKEFKYSSEYYRISFFSNSGCEIMATARDIGSSAINKLIDTYIAVIDDLIDEKMKELEEI